MAFRLVSTVQEGATFNFNSGDSIFVSRTGGFISDNNFSTYAFYHLSERNLLTVTVEGFIAGENGVSLRGNSNHLSVAASGTVAGGAAFTIVGDETLITNAGQITGLMDIEGDLTRVVNSGMISGQIDLFGDDLTVSNSGTIANDNAIFAAVIMYTALAGQTSTLSNSGLITTASDLAIASGLGDDQIINSGTISGSIVLGGGTGDDRLTNTGTIEGSVSGFGSDGARVWNHGDITGNLSLSTGTDVITNTGTVLQVEFFGGSGDRLINTGTIEQIVEMAGALGEIRNQGSIGAVLMGNGNDVLINSGFIDGAYLGAGAGFDRFVNSGTIETTLTALGTGGADVTNRGSIIGSLTTGGGADVVRNWGTIRQVDLGAGNDLYSAAPTGTVDLTVLGGNGNDRLLGGDQDDSLSGDSGNDILSGRGGDDALFGGATNDTLFGGDGSDILRGGTGADRATGGGGADIFVFATSAELVTSGSFDVITDFARGTDLIDLSAMTGVLQFNGTAAFSGGGVRSVNYAVSAGNTTLRIDATGDGVSDGSIVLLGITGLAAGDLLL